VELAPQALGLRTLLVQWLGEGEQDLILGTVPGMKLHQEPPATWVCFGDGFGQGGKSAKHGESTGNGLGNL